MKQSVRLGQGIDFLTAINVASEVARGELVVVPLTEGRSRPLRPTDIVRSRHKTNLMSNSVIRVFVRPARVLTSSG